MCKKFFFRIFTIQNKIYCILFQEPFKSDFFESASIQTCIVFIKLNFRALISRSFNSKFIVFT